MHTLRAILVAGLLGAIAGCRATDENARMFNPWGCDNARDFKVRLDDYKHVFMVCIYEDHWEDQGPNRYSLHHYKGTVVRVYKGDWHVSEKVAFVQGLDYPALTSSNKAAGNLGFVFTSHHSETEIGLDTEEFSRYDAASIPALDRVFSEKCRR